MENNQNKSGPKTPEGKAVSKLNALKHGILSQEVLIEGEDENTLKSLSEALIDELKPVGPIEEMLVDRIISSLWRLRRSVNADKNTMEYIKNDGFISISNFKERFDLSRKYLITYLDYLDNYSDIKKVEDKRLFV